MPSEDASRWEELTEPSARNGFVQQARKRRETRDSNQVEMTCSIVSSRRVSFAPSRGTQSDPNKAWQWPPSHVVEISAKRSGLVGHFCYCFCHCLCVWSREERVPVCFDMPLGHEDDGV